MTFKEKLGQFKDFLDVIRGKEDINQKFSFLFQPRNIKTASRLSNSQAEFLSDSHFLVKHFPEFQPLQNLALEVAECGVSVKGKRVEEAIAFQKASKTAGPSSQMGLFNLGKPEKKKKEKETKD